MAIDIPSGLSTNKRASQTIKGDWLKEIFNDLGKSAPTYGELIHDLTGQTRRKRSLFGPEHMKMMNSRMNKDSKPTMYDLDGVIDPRRTRRPLLIKQGRFRKRIGPKASRRKKGTDTVRLKP